MRRAAQPAAGGHGCGAEKRRHRPEKGRYRTPWQGCSTLRQRRTMCGAQSESLIAPTASAGWHSRPRTARVVGAILDAHGSGARREFVARDVPGARRTTPRASRSRVAARGATAPRKRVLPAGEKRACRLVVTSAIREARRHLLIWRAAGPDRRRARAPDHGDLRQRAASYLGLDEPADYPSAAVKRRSPKTIVR